MPILLDYSGISMSSILTQLKHAEPSEDFIRHIILNSIRGYNEKFRRKYGELVVVCDGGSWRKDAFEHYKASRKTNREKSKTDWSEVYRLMNMVKDEIHEFLPYRVMQSKGAEADDIIAVLAQRSQEVEFGETIQPVMVVSSDQDFCQLQKFKNVEQFSHMNKKLLVEPHPTRYLFEHIIKGDSGDGIPNILSAEDTFVSGARQTPITAKKIEAVYAAKTPQALVEVFGEDALQRFNQNRQLIDFDCIPAELKARILDIFDKYPKKDNSKVLNYLVSKNCRQLISCAQDFFIK